MNVILLAAPGAGKGTQAELISLEYGLKHISTGDLLREAVLKNNDISNLIQTEMENGEFVDDDIIISLIRGELKDNKNGIIFDGFPRNVHQAILLDELFLENNEQIDYVINITLDKEILKKRIVGRLTCSKCKSIYNENFTEHAPKKKGICDKCGNELLRRKDDSILTFENRYQTYLDETEPLIDYYRKLNKLVEVDNSFSKFDAFNKIKEILKND